MAVNAANSACPLGFVFSSWPWSINQQHRFTGSLAAVFCFCVRMYGKGTAGQEPFALLTRCRFAMRVKAPNCNWVYELQSPLGLQYNQNWGYKLQAE